MTSVRKSGIWTLIPTDGCSRRFLRTPIAVCVAPPPPKVLPIWEGSAVCAERPVRTHVCTSEQKKKKKKRLVAGRTLRMFRCAPGRVAFARVDASAPPWCQTTFSGGKWRICVRADGGEFSCAWTCRSADSEGFSFWFASRSSTWRTWASFTKDRRRSEVGDWATKDSDGRYKRGWKMIKWTR